MTDIANENQKLFVPALGGLYRMLSPYSYAFMRFCTGAVLVPHGWSKVASGWATGAGIKAIAGKGLPFPEVLAYLTVFSEFAAAILLAIGLFTRFAAATVAIQMAVVMFVFQWQYGYFWTDKGVEYALLLMLLCIAIVFRGGERCSVDRLIGREL